MIEIVPNWHPVIVHFAVGLLLTAVVLFVAATILRSQPYAPALTVAARINLWIGVAFAGLALVSGFNAYMSVAHDDAGHAAMSIHMTWAYASAGLFGLATALSLVDRKRLSGASLPLLAVMIAGGTALAVTGYLGAENVYRHGLGVMRLPAAAPAGHDEAAPHAHESGPVPAAAIEAPTVAPAPAAPTAPQDHPHDHPHDHKHPPKDGG